MTTMEMAESGVEPTGAAPATALSRRACERAMLTRDRRFDGRFFIAVRTTGVYCRPVCPVPAPKLENVDFFPSAAAAADAGYRPCLRCRPEAAPGTPAWNGTATSVSRALRLIEAGALDGGTLEELAPRLGMSARHLDRLFQQHLGASPGSVARTRRLHFAKRLLDETDLPMTEVAMQAGFGSVRRFNEVIRDTYGRPPLALRRLRRRRQTAPALRLALSYRPPFAWHDLLAFFSARAIPGVEAVIDGAYHRTVVVQGVAGQLRVRRLDEAAAGGGLVVEVVLPRPKGLLHIVERTRQVFDLGADPEAIAAHLAEDPLLAPLLRWNAGLRLPGAWDGFELAVRAILGQQVSVRGATTLAGRLVERWGSPLAPVGETTPDGQPRWLFPTPATLAEADIAAIGMPRARGSAIRGLAAAVASGEIELGAGASGPELRQRLVALPGIGDWTAQYVSMRALGDPDAFPSTDLGLLRALKGLGEEMSAAQLRRRAERWRPWRAYAAILLWSAARGGG